MTPKKVLLIEDDRSLVKLYKVKLEKEGYDVRYAEDGEACLRLVEEYVPDVILLDIIIPKVDGFEVLKRLRKDPRFKDLPVILFTNLGQDDDVQKGKTFGATAYLIKANLTPSDVVKKVKEALDK